jgi:hypothetical protein
MSALNGGICCTAGDDGGDSLWCRGNYALDALFSLTANGVVDQAKVHFRTAPRPHPRFRMPMVPCARRPRTISTRSGKRGLCHIHHGQFATSARCMARAHATHARTHAHAQMRRELHGHLWCSVCGGEHHLARVHQQSVRRVLLYFAEQLQACPPCAMPCHAGQPAQPFPARPPHPAAEQQWRTHCACQRAPAGASLGVRGMRRRSAECGSANGIDERMHWYHTGARAWARTRAPTYARMGMRNARMRTRPCAL